MTFEIINTRSHEIFFLDRKVNRVGRSHPCDINIHDDKSVSRIHAVFKNDGYRVMVWDHDSQNGVFVNGQRLESTRALTSGDKIQLGKTEFLFMEQAEEERSMQSVLREKW